MKGNSFKNVIYICTRVFNYSDKLQAECFEESLMNLKDIHVFMPFRDTDEHNLKGENRTRLIYEADMERLNSGEIALLAVLYDGISKDEGISFEIGYAYGKRIPIFITNTDFIWYANNHREFLFDPIVEYMCSDYIHYYTIGEKQTFKEALLAGQKNAFDEAAKKIKSIIDSNGKNREYNFNFEKEYDVFIDFGGGKYEYQREYALWLKTELLKHNISTEIADRYVNDISINHCEKGRKDIERLLKSCYYVCLGDESELNSGTAALLGLARGKGIKTILYESSNIEIHGENNHKMTKNLMIDFSIDIIAKTKEQIIDILLEEKMFEKLKNDILNCRDCREKFGFEPHPILMGNVNSKIMQISQAPSQNVHKTLKPFDDASGRKLRKEWYHISDEVFYNPDNFYIAAIAHCYPGKSANGGDRLPPKSCAKKWLLKELKLVNNDIFLIIGRNAANFFFPKEDFTSLIFKDNFLNGKLTFVLPHPSPLNARWFKEHPDFLQSRIKQIQKTIHKVLD